MMTFYEYLNIGYQFILYDFTQNQTNYDAVIGFTTDLDYKITHSHDRKDHSVYLDGKFTDRVADRNYVYCSVLKEEYRKINLKDALMKLQPVIIPLFRRKIGDTIKNNKYINNFLNWYN